MRKFVLLVLLAVLLPSAEPFLTVHEAWCESSSAPAIWVVDMQRVISESQSGKAARADIELEIKKRQSKLELKKSALQQKRADLAKQQALLSKDALAERQAAIEKQERDLVRELRDEQDALTRHNQVEIERLVKQIHQVVEQLSKEQKKQLVIEQDRRVVLYVSERYDFTAAVIQSLDRKTGKL